MVTVRVPATSANLGPGFDLLGLALPLYNTVTLDFADALSITNHGPEAQGLPTHEGHLAFRAVKKLCEHLDRPVPALRMAVDVQIPQSRGLGSSSAAIVGGFALSTLTINLLGSGSGMGTFFSLTGLTVLLALASLSVGYLISAFARRTSTALGIAIVTWLVLVLVGDLGLMGTAVVLKLSPGELLGLTLVNPLEVYRIASIDLLRDSLELLGPAGLAAHDWFGGAIGPALIGMLVLWIAAPLAAAYVAMTRGERRS